MRHFLLYLPSAFVMNSLPGSVKLLRDSSVLHALYDSCSDNLVRTEKTTILRNL